MTHMIEIPVATGFAECAVEWGQREWAVRQFRDETLQTRYDDTPRSGELSLIWKRITCFSID